MSQAIAIANHLLERDVEARRQGRQLPIMSPMKALKLAFYAHGWYYGLNGRRLVTDEQVEAWTWGPVFPSLYHAAKQFGNGAINHPLDEVDFGRVITPRPTLATEFADRDPQAVAAWLGRMFEQYGSYDAIGLSNATHIEGTPWDIIYNGVYGGRPPKGTDIPPDLIQTYFHRWAEEGQPPRLTLADAGGRVA